MATQAEKDAEVENVRRRIEGVSGTAAANTVVPGMTTIVNREHRIEEVDPNDYQYGGRPGGAQEAAARYRAQAEGAQGRQGVHVYTGDSDQTRGSALSMADLMARRARGETPSIAGMVGQQNIGRAIADQTSQAASARGPAALALAQQGAANNTANAVSTINNQTQVNQANERLQAEQAAFGAYSGTSGQDAQRAQAQGALDASKQQQNDAYQLGMTGFETGVQTAQLGANMNKGAANQAGAANYQSMLQQRKAGQDAATGQMLQAGASTAGMAAMAMSDENAKVPASFDRSPNQSVEQTQSTYGPGVAQPDIHADAAARALSAVYGPPAGQGSGGPMAVEQGIGALKRRNDEDLALIQSKERVGAKLTKKEAWMRPVMERRMRMDAGQGAAPPGAPSRGARAPEREKPTTGEYVGSALQGIGKAFAPAAPPPAAHYIAPQMVPLAAPGVMSDDKTKLRAAWDEGHTAALANVEERSRQTPAELAAADADGSDVAAAVRGIKARTWDETAAAGKRDVVRAASDARNAEQNAQMDQQNAAMAARIAESRKEHGFVDPAAKPVPAPPPEEPGFFARLSPMASRMRSMVSDESAKTFKPFRVTHEDGRSMMITRPGQDFDSPGNDRLSAEEKADLTSGPRDVGTLGKQIDHADVADFARSLRGVPYSYKDEYAAREGQAPGEVNVGPVAQEIEKSKIGATIVKPDPQGSGMRTLDQPKMVKGLGAVVADQQEQLDEMRSLMARRMGGRR